MVVKKEILPRRFPDIEIIYGDTDSVMVVFRETGLDVESCGKRADEAAKYVTEYFIEILGLQAMELEFEKVFAPYMLQKKKRYMGLKYEPDKDGNMICKGIDAKGVETERKDTLPFVKDIMFEVRDALMYRCDEHEALQRFENKMELLFKGLVPIEKLTLRKNLSSKVASKTDTIAHAYVNAKRREREPGSEASVNEQVEYAIVRGPLNEKTTRLAEDPVFIVENNLKLNELWYFEHCIEEALRKMFEVFEHIDFKKICDLYRAKLKAILLGVQVDAFNFQSEAWKATTGAVPKRAREIKAPPPMKRKQKPKTQPSK